MSIKIYDGMRATVSDPFEAAGIIRKTLQPIFFEKFKEIYDEYAELLDSADGEVVKWNNLPKYFYKDDGQLEGKFMLDFDLYNKIQELNRQTTHTLSDADICYHVSLIPNKIKGANPLVLIYGEFSNIYREALTNSGVTEDYGYWDNGDYDEDISKSEWVEREEAWGHLLGDKSPSEVELGISCPSRFETTMWLSKKRRAFKTA